MSIKIIEDRIAYYRPANKRDEINALKEIVQEIALSALSRSGFFKVGAFHGGTCLRIAYDLPRFSEDLDFILYKNNLDFVWQPYIKEIETEFKLYDLSLKIIDRSKANQSVKKAFLKEHSFGKILNLQYERNASDKQVITIKLEIDTAPPLGSVFENKIVEFPSPFSMTIQNIESLFAGKIHALLCRTYVKGRDWYDFIWYVTRKANINYNLLCAALIQQGPWQGKNLTINKDWLIKHLEKKIKTIDWETAKNDVINFIKPREMHSIELWNNEFFEHFTKRLADYLA